MSKTEAQSEALRLARLLESGCWLPVGHGDPIDEAAAELRRLDAEVRELKMTVQHESLCVEAAKERIEALDAENKALRERLEATPEGLRRYHFVQRSKFGPWVEVEQETEASTAFVKEADIATQAAAKNGGAA